MTPQFPRAAAAIVLGLSWSASLCGCGRVYFETVTSDGSLDTAQDVSVADAPSPGLDGAPTDAATADAATADAPSGSNMVSIGRNSADDIGVMRDVELREGMPSNNLGACTQSVFGESSVVLYWFDLSEIRSTAVV